MSEPMVWCKTCAQAEYVVPGRGFPPATAKRKLAKRCKAAGHESAPQYRAGLDPGLIAIFRGRAASLSEEQA